MSTSSETTGKPHGSTAIETIQSLIVAFAIAMIFRGFVVEGFVIPTGSMAPTLLGQHMQVRSNQTGSVTPVGLDLPAGLTRLPTEMLRDHQAGREQPFADQHALTMNGPRFGDRILVAKWLYPFSEPDRWDVVVFKNPASPEGATGTYIKRLIGLPGETIWIVDGDIFVRGPGETRFHIARKPQHVAESAWQTVWTSVHTPQQPLRLPQGWSGMPWLADPAAAWKTEGETLQSTGVGPVTLRWDDRRFPLDDWNAYNMFGPRAKVDFPVSDLRVAATLTPEASGLSTSLDLTARGHVFRYAIEEGRAAISMWPVGAPSKVERVQAEVPPLQPGMPARFVAEHLDQAARLRLNGSVLLELEYDWTPHERLVASRGVDGAKLSDGRLSELIPTRPSLSWSFSGSPVSLTRMEVDRDIFYRPGVLTAHAMKNAPTSEFAADVQPGRPAAATHPDHLPTLGPDQFFVLGDNSGRSLDGRLWGAPAAIVAEQVDPTPFVVPRELLIGKAFVVYFPAPASGIIPDFGSLRFIH
ncbi:MAG: S26 family signal peptidase [Phycisphaerales bacterium]|jgi:signal peptidase I|nr:S26 family signal peptidase [Phycisphaerales bacterium]